MVKKIAVLGDYVYGRPAMHVFPEAESKSFDTHTDSPLKSLLRFNPDLIQFTGGSDVDPSLYRAKKDPRSMCNPQRDAIEQEIYHAFPNTTKVGICRGSQFLWVMLGGGLIQHIDHHGIGGEHRAWMVPSYVGSIVAAKATKARYDDYVPYDGYKYDTEEPFGVTSTHHQAANANDEPPNTWVSLYGEHNDVMAVEGWHWHKNGAPGIAAVQYHPEYMAEDSPGFLYYCDVIRYATGSPPVVYAERFLGNP